MQYLAAFLIILIAAAGGGMIFTDLPNVVARLGLIEQDERSSAREQKEAASPPAAETPAATERTPSGAFDIAKVDPQGTSVFAGRSVTKFSVTVFADGIAIGSANTDENGEWVLILDRPLPNPNPKLTVQTGTVAPPAPPSPQAIANGGAPELRSAEAVSVHLMDALRRRVERAKADAEQQARMSEPATALDRPRDGIGERSIPDAVVATAVYPTTLIASNDVLPIPIQFVFREAQFTDDGAKAAQLLLDYLLLKKPPVIKMTGHADERGTAEFNMKLSADRLATVSKFLRAGGFAGQVELLPKGDTAPFTGVDRTVMPRDQLYELDRRVELQFSEEGSPSSQQQ